MTLLDDFLTGQKQIMVVAYVSAILTVFTAFIIYYGSLPPTSLATEKLLDSYDYVIVGSGSAGSVLASRLSEDPEVSVLVLEAGIDHLDDDRHQIPSCFVALMKSDSDWEYYTEPQRYSSQGLKDKRSYWPRGKVLGGSSTTNGMMYARGLASDYDEWEDLGCSGWGWKDVLPYYKKSEDILISHLEESEYHGKGGPLAVSENTASSVVDLFLQAGLEAGYKLIDYNNGEDEEGISRAQSTVRNGVRSSTGLEFLGRVSDRSNLHIGINSMVTKIDIQDKTATGVHVIRSGKKHYIAALKEVIVSAGSINSPHLLMLSGIGPKSHLQELHIPVKADLPVGENLQDHLILMLHSPVNISGTLTKSYLDSWISKLRYALFGTGPLATAGLEAVGFFCSTQNAEGKCIPDIQFIFTGLLFPLNFNDMNDEVASEYFTTILGHEGFTVFNTLVNPKSVGRILLRSTDPFDHPIIDPNYLSDQRDVDVMIAGVRVWERFLETQVMMENGASPDLLRFSICSHYKFRSDAFWECYIRHVASTVYHPVGTCKMGPDNDPTAVVDTQLRVRGINRLRVVDASIMPNVPSANTNAPAIMVAEKAADMIKGKNTEQSEGSKYEYYYNVYYLMNIVVGLFSLAN